MDHEGCKVLYNEQRKKYIELKKSFIALRNSYIELKKSHLSSLSEIERLKKENESLKAVKIKKGKSILMRETQMESELDEQFSHFLLKQPSRVYETGRIKQVNPDQSVYMGTNDTSIYQGFLIVGPQESKIGISDPLIPEILFEFFPGSANIGQNIKSIIPTLCFPSSIFIESNEDRTKCQSPRSKPPSLHQQSKEFVITVKNENLSSRPSDFPNSDHELLYIICYEFQELVKSGSSSWWVPVSYCLASFIPAFDLHFSVLRRLVFLRKSQKSPKSCQKSSKFASINKYEEILLELFKECEDLQPFKMIQFGLEDCGFIRYRCPRRLSDIDVRWTVIFLIQHLISDDFLWLLFAISQEKSIVFVSSDSGVTSACVLALHCLLRPLKWPNLMIPLIPESLMELLEAPIPVLAGVNYVQAQKRNELDSVIWVMLDEKNVGKRIVKFRNGEEDVVIPAWPEGIRQIKILYPTLNDKIEINEELYEKAEEIKNVLAGFWSEILESGRDSKSLNYGEDFLEAVKNTQMFSVTLGY